MKRAVDSPCLVTFQLVESTRDARAALLSKSARVSKVRFKRPVRIHAPQKKVFQTAYNIYLITAADYSSTETNEYLK